MAGSTCRFSSQLFLFDVDDRSEAAAGTFGQVLGVVVFEEDTSLFDGGDAIIRRTDVSSAAGCRVGAAGHVTGDRNDIAADVCHNHVSFFGFDGRVLWVTANCTKQANEQLFFVIVRLNE